MTKPTMDAIDSSNLAEIGYDALAKELWVQFKGNGPPYIYEDVPEELFIQFKSAESKGAFFHANIKSVFRYWKDV